MLPLELKPAERRAYRTALTRSHRQRVEIDVLNQDEEPIGSLTAERKLVVSGQIDVDVTSSPARRLTLTLFDPHNRLQFDPDSPSEAAVFAHRMLRVRKGIYVQAIQQWIDVPVFYGPIIGYERENAEVTLTAGSKEILYQADYVHLRARSWKKGASIRNVMREILSDMGETRFDFPEFPAKLPHDLAITRHEEPWTVLQRLAGSVNRQLFFDARGRAKLRLHPRHPVYHFHGGHDGTLLTSPKVSYAGEFHNCVEVLGPKPEAKDHTPRIRGWAVAPPAHPLSPGRLARNGEPVHRMLSLGADSPGPRPDKLEKGATKKERERYWNQYHRWHHLLVVDQHKAQDIAERTLAEELRLAEELTFDALPIFELEERDPISVNHDGEYRESLLQRFTLPLGSEAPMTINENRRVPQHLRKRRK